MPEVETPTIVLVGMMGSGKSSVGKALAARTGWCYMDNDELVRVVTGRAPQDIDASDGEAALHAAEADALRHALTVPPPVVVSAAAWVVNDASSLELLRGQTAVVYLRAQPETLHARIGAGLGRRDDATDLAWLRARARERDARYRDVSRLTVETDTLTSDVAAERILRALLAAEV